MATKKKDILTAKEYSAIIRDMNNLLTKISKKKQSISDTYSRDFLDAAYRAVALAKSNMGNVAHS